MIGDRYWSLELSLKQVRWSVGLGASIRLSEDRWLLRPSSFRPTTSCAGWRRGAVVTSLIDTESASWDVGLVRALFPPHDTDSILAVPVHRLVIDEAKNSKQKMGRAALLVNPLTRSSFGMLECHQKSSYLRGVCAKHPYL
ncbi:UNVERIFIED_CONTAM: hypothetical protein Sradi_3610900 [Sesamum radiatum]|uniref:Uncharacterized protein n=1 Tax=Sesamum radiatum TaxID=300843 RepID=A0AAW2QIX4_SESRA